MVVSLSAPMIVVYVIHESSSSSSTVSAAQRRCTVIPLLLFATWKWHTPHAFRFSTTGRKNRLTESLSISFFFFSLTFHSLFTHRSNTHRSRPMLQRRYGTSIKIQRAHKDNPTTFKLIASNSRALQSRKSATKSSWTRPREERIGIRIHVSSISRGPPRNQIRWNCFAEF